MPSSDMRGQRQRIEEALAESEQKFRAVFDQATIGIALGTLEGRCLRANKAACDFIGATEKDVCRLSIQDIVHPADLPMTKDVFPRLVAGEIPYYTVERRYVRRDKTIVWGRARVSLIRDAQGKPSYLVGVMENVTQEKLVEKQRAALSRLGYGLSGVATRDQAARIILDVASELFGWDAGYFHLYSERTGEFKLVLTVDTIKGKRVHVPAATLSPEPSPMMRKVMKEGGQLLNRSTGSADSIELIPFGNKRHRAASLMFVPVRSGGVAVGILSIQSYTPAAYSGDDLTLLQTLADLCGDALERVKLTEALREAEAKYRSIFENAAEGIFQATPEGKYLSANPALARMFGYQSAEELMATVTDIGRQTFVIPAKRVEMMRSLQLQGTVQRFEVERYRKDGTVFWVSTDAHAVRDSSGRVLFYEGTNHDITEVVRAREALTRSHEELERIVRERTAQLEAANQALRDEMADRKRLERQVLEGIEHEQERIGQDLHDGLCQLLTGIKFKSVALGTALRQKGLAEADQTIAIETLVNQAINQGYGVARGLNPMILPGHGLTLALKELAAGAAAAFDLSCLCKFPEPLTMDDPTVANHLYRIAQEAIYNAIKHGKARSITLTLTTQSGELELTILDDGVGISADSKPGMGLQNMKARAGMMGATLDIRAHTSGGTVVTCILQFPNPQSKSG